MAGKLLELRSKRRRKHLAFPLPIFWPTSIWPPVLQLPRVTPKQQV
jgi:hypothetical protein